MAKKLTDCENISTTHEQYRIASYGKAIGLLLHELTDLKEPQSKRKVRINKLNVNYKINVKGNYIVHVAAELVNKKQLRTVC